MNDGDFTRSHGMLDMRGETAATDREFLLR